MENKNLFEQKNKLSEQTKWNYSPFTKIVSTSSHVKTLILNSPNEQIISNNISQDLTRTPGMIRIQKVDNEKYVKIYTQFITAWFNLSAPGQRILGYIMSILPINKDTVRVNIEDAMSYAEYQSEVSVYNGLNDLVNKKIIARSMEVDMYFINPAFIFNGSRAIFAEGIELTDAALAEKLGSGHSRGLTSAQQDQDIEGVQIVGAEGGLLSRRKK